MKLPEFGFLEKCKIVGKTLLVQVCLFITLLLLAWGSQALYAKLDRTEFPTPVQITDADKLDENAKGKALVDAITHQMRYELDSTFGWSINDILFNRFVLDNRAYRQYGVYHATKVLMDLYSMTIAKLGTNDRESEMLYKARLNSFAIDPRSFMFPSAESSYKKGLKLIEQYKESHDPEPLELSVSDAAEILRDNGVEEEQILAFRDSCVTQFGDGATLNPANLIDSSRFEVKTADATISLDPEHSYLVETRIIDGRKYLLIPADEDIEVNGFGVRVKGE